VANVDADTVLTPGWLENVLNHFQNDEELVALSGPHIYADLPLAKRFFAKVFYAGGYITYLINRFVLKVGSMLQGGNFVVRRSALEKINGFNTNFNFYGEDTEIACRLHRVGKVKFTFSLPIIASSRRIKAEGFLSMGFKYGINYFWTIIFRKPFTKTFIDVRIPKKK
jgi:GT2 family glycosyltransferase